MASPAVLVIGYGNPAREDDGLGPLVAGRIAALGLPGVLVDSDYQPAVEDAAAVAEHEEVVFVDASVDCRAPFSWAPVAPESIDAFSSHALTPARVVGLARELFGARARAWVLGVRGYSFRMFREGATARGKRNARRAVRFLKRKLAAERGRP